MLVIYTIYYQHILPNDRNIKGNFIIESYVLMSIFKSHDKLKWYGHYCLANFRISVKEI